MSDEIPESEKCSDCGGIHIDEVPFILSATARLVIEKALNMTLDPSNPLNQLLVMGAGMVLDGIKNGLVKEQEFDMSALFSEAGSDE